MQHFMGVHFMVRVFPCKICVVFPMCLNRYRKWKQTLYKKHPEWDDNLTVLDYGITLISQCSHLNDFMYSYGRMSYNKRT